MRALLIISIFMGVLLFPTFASGQCLIDTIAIDTLPCCRPISASGDVNNDGHDDIAVVSHRMKKVFIYSGLDLSLLYVLENNNPELDFGASVAINGDLNGDGFDDIITGAPNNTGQAGHAGFIFVYSGANGGLLYTISSNAVSQYFAQYVAIAGDVNKDGYDDIVASSDVEDTLAYVFSGFDGSELYAFANTVCEYNWWGGVAGAGDVNNDGYDDIIIGVIGDFTVEPGHALVYSGRTGKLLYDLTDNRPDYEFGYHVSGLGDLNHDGFADFGATTGCEANLYIYSGLNGSLLGSIEGDGSCNYSMANAGDVNKDGTNDILLGGSIYSGVDDSLLFQLERVWYSAAGDFNADGYPEVVINNDSSAYIYTLGDGDCDGLADDVDSCTDTDSDGYGNPGYPYNTCQLDNCPNNYNPDQSDRDGDGKGDSCDACYDMVFKIGADTVYIKNTAPQDSLQVARIPLGAKISEQIPECFLSDSLKMVAFTFSFDTTILQFDTAYTDLAYYYYWSTGNIVEVFVDFTSALSGGPIPIPPEFTTFGYAEFHAKCQSQITNTPLKALGGKIYIDASRYYFTELIDGEISILEGELQCFQCGDATFDGKVNVLDITFLINFLYKHGKAPYIPESGDVNNSGAINIMDITALINNLYKNGQPLICP